MTSSQSQAPAARRFAWSNGLQNIADELVSAKTILPWIFDAAGVPHVFTALLVPIRESGSMLPQAALTPWVSIHAARKRLWLVGSVGQGLCALGLAAAALLTKSWFLGVLSIVVLGFLSIFRALCSITGKDVQGRTISKGSRGLVTGRAAQIGGAGTLITGVTLALFSPVPNWALALVLGCGAIFWLLAAEIFRGIREPVPDTDTPERGIDKHWLTDTWRLYSQEADFRAFVNVRALMLITALSTSFIVALASSSGHSALSGLAGFVLASGMASLIGGRISGIWSDRSSKDVMSAGALAASLTLLGVIACAAWAPAAVNAWALPLGFFLVNLAHTFIRVARKTYVVDMASGDRRTQYVGAANTMMGLFLLVLGVISAAVALAGPIATLLFFACVGLFGSYRARALKDVSAPV